MRGERVYSFAGRIQMRIKWGVRVFIVVEHILDLRGEKCPDTFLFTKIRAEELREDGRVGDTLKVIVDYEPSTVNIPKSIVEEGHEFLGIERVKKRVWAIRIKIK